MLEFEICRPPQAAETREDPAKCGGLLKRCTLIIISGTST
jgi:hypothetical protein